MIDVTSHFLVEQVHRRIQGGKAGPTASQPLPPSHAFSSASDPPASATFSGTVGGADISW